MKEKFIIYKIRNKKDGTFARQHRGIRFVKGQGSSWSKRSSFLHTIVSAINGYCGSGNKLSAADIEIISFNNKGVITQSLKEFLTTTELNTLKNRIIENMVRRAWWKTPMSKVCRQQMEDYDWWGNWNHPEGLTKNQFNEYHDRIAKAFEQRFITKNQKGWFELVF